MLLILLVLWQDLERLKAKIAAAAAPAAGESRAETGAGGDRTGLSVARHLGMGFAVAGVHCMHEIGKVCPGLDVTGARGLVAAAGVRGEMLRDWHFRAQRLRQVKETCDFAVAEGLLLLLLLTPVSILLPIITTTTTTTTTTTNYHHHHHHHHYHYHYNYHFHQQSYRQYDLEALTQNRLLVTSCWLRGGGFSAELIVLTSGKGSR